MSISYTDMYQRDRFKESDLYRFDLQHPSLVSLGEYQENPFFKKITIHPQNYTS